MNKEDFLAKLREGLSGYPKEDVEERISFYSELLDDKMEDGASENAAIAEIGDVSELISKIVEDIPLSKIVKERIKPKRKFRVFEIILLVLGSPIWLAVLVSLFAVLLSVYIVIWAVIVALWAAFVAFCAATLAGILPGIALISRGNATSGIVMICAGIVSAGLAILTYFGCFYATKGAVLLTKKIALLVKSMFQRKENA